MIINFQVDREHGHLHLQFSLPVGTLGVRKVCFKVGFKVFAMKYIVC